MTERLRDRRARVQRRIAEIKQQYQQRVNDLAALDPDARELRGFALGLEEAMTDEVSDGTTG